MVIILNIFSSDNNYGFLNDWLNFLVFFAERICNLPTFCRVCLSSTEYEITIISFPDKQISIYWNCKLYSCHYFHQILPQDRDIVLITSGYISISTICTLWMHTFLWWIWWLFIHMKPVVQWWKQLLEYMSSWFHLVIFLPPFSLYLYIRMSWLWISGLHLLE